jgi:hypothetical protein
MAQIKCSKCLEIFKADIQNQKIPDFMICPMCKREGIVIVERIPYMRHPRGFGNTVAILEEKKIRITLI